jgi:hypothetical protein
MCRVYTTCVYDVHTIHMPRHAHTCATCACHATCHMPHATCTCHAPHLGVAGHHLLLVHVLQRLHEGAADGEKQPHRKLVVAAASLLTAVVLVIDHGRRSHQADGEGDDDDACPHVRLELIAQHVLLHQRHEDCSPRAHTHRCRVSSGAAAHGPSGAERGGAGGGG